MRSLKLDRRVSILLFRWKRIRWIAVTAWFFSLAGSGYVLFPVLAAILYLGWIETLSWVGAVVAFAVQSGLVVAVKYLVRRERPVRTRHDRYSFPSGHAARVGVLTCLVPSVVTFAFALCVALSRIILRRHFVLDIIAGFFIGVVSAMIGGVVAPLLS